jgi:hypothetical protein
LHPHSRGPGDLGHQEAAAHALENLLLVRPDFPVDGREDLGKWFDAGYVEQLIEGLRLAGLDVRGTSTPPGTKDL